METQGGQFRHLPWLARCRQSSYVSQLPENIARHWHRKFRLSTSEWKRGALKHVRPRQTCGHFRYRRCANTFAIAVSTSVADMRTKDTAAPNGQLFRLNCP